MSGKLRVVGTGPRHAATDETQDTRLSQRALDALAWVMTVAVALVLWPSAFGGMTTFTIIQGNSMLPTYETGDLVLAWGGKAPQVGDIVVYQPETLGGARIIHRLVDVTDDGEWIAQGDNNDWLDPFTISDEEILGVAVFRVNKLGFIGSVLSSPWVALSLILIAAGIVFYPTKQDEDEDEDEEKIAEIADERE